jgi:hypothetical protein
MIGGWSRSKGRRNTTNANVRQWNEEAALKIFEDTLAEADDNTIATMEGISQLCDLLEIDPLEDIRILVLMWKMGVGKEKPQQVTRDEWKDGCENLNVDSLEKLKQLLPSLDIGFLEATQFRDFYKFCFKFNCEGTYKTIDKEMIAELNPMVLKDRIAQDRIMKFKEFLNGTDDASYQRITLDQWMSFLDFSLECQDLDEYDEENSAWPTLIDDYVDYLKDSMQV